MILFYFVRQQLLQSVSFQAPGLQLFTSLVWSLSLHQSFCLSQEVRHQDLETHRHRASASGSKNCWEGEFKTRIHHQQTEPIKDGGFTATSHWQFETCSPQSVQQHLRSLWTGGADSGVTLPCGGGCLRLDAETEQEWGSQQESFEYLQRKEQNPDHHRRSGQTVTVGLLSADSGCLLSDAKAANRGADAPVCHYWTD